MSTTGYPIPKFHFQVEWGGKNIGFSEVTGLTVETEVIEYRHGSSPEFSKVKMPGMQKFSNITLKRGVFKKDGDFADWMKTTKMNTVERRAVTISLLDENGDPAVTWKIKNAFPIKVISPDLKADGNEVAIESLELAHEGLTIQNN